MCQSVPVTSIIVLRDTSAYQVDQLMMLMGG